MKDVIYARYSSDNQREESIEGQLRECKAYAEKNSIEIIGTYIDRALSAKTDNRPEFQKMIKDSNKCIFDIVLVWKLDRFARNRYDSAFYKATLKKNNVKLMSATENISDGADGILLEAILEGFAEYYSVELAEKIKRGMTENALKLRSNGVRAPIGYYIDSEKHFQIDEEKAPIIADIFTMYNNGKKISEIVEIIQNEIRNPILSKDQILFALNNYRKLDLSIQSDKQKLIDSFVNSIYLYDDHFIITFNYKNSSKKGTFKEINSSSLTSFTPPNINHA